MYNPFSVYHPAVAFCYVACAIAFSMAVFHPVYIGLSLVGGFAASCCVRGLRATLRIVAPMCVLWVVIAFGNGLVGGAGQTTLFWLLGRPFKLEALCYGGAMGAMFCAMMLWCSVYAAVMDSEAQTAVMARFLPTVSLMVQQVMRLVPQFLRRGHAIADAQRATTAARAQGNVRGEAMRSLTVLMGWGMEDGILRASAMRSRGYGAPGARTLYKRRRFAWRDGVAVAVLAVLALACALLGAHALEQFSFYPYMDSIAWWWGYLPYAVFVAVPVLLWGRDRVQWML